VLPSWLKGSDPNFTITVFWGQPGALTTVSLRNSSIYVDDVARATVRAMASEVSGESFVIATGVDTSLNEIAQILLRLTGSSLQPFYQDQPGTVAVTTKATQLLGWEAQVGIEEGIRRLIAWAEGRHAL